MTGLRGRQEDPRGSLTMLTLSSQLLSYSSINDDPVSDTKHVSTREMTQWSSLLVPLAENLDSVPSSVSGDLMASPMNTKHTGGTHPYIEAYTNTHKSLRN